MNRCQGCAVAVHLSDVPAENGPTGDPDHDGAANLAEFFYGTDPRVAIGLDDGLKSVSGGSSGVFGVQLFERAGL